MSGTKVEEIRERVQQVRSRFVGQVVSMDMWAEDVEVLLHHIDTLQRHYDSTLAEYGRLHRLLEAQTRFGQAGGREMRDDESKADE